MTNAEAAHALRKVLENEKARKSCRIDKDALKTAVRALERLEEMEGTK